MPRKFTEHPFWEKKVDLKRGLSFIMNESDEKVDEIDERMMGFHSF